MAALCVSLLRGCLFKNINSTARIQTFVHRHNSTIEELSAEEMRLQELVRTKMDVHDVSVRDISGGCGAMYEVYVCSNEFKGKRVVQQHRMITEILKEEVKNMHGLRIHTEVP